MTGVVISSGFVLSPGVDGLNLDSPIIGYHNLVSDATITATTEDAGYPATNLSNPATHLRWRGVLASPAGDDYLTIAFDPLAASEDVDYLAIAGHNFGTIQAPVSVEGATSPLGGSPESWVELITDHLLPNDGPTIFRFTKQPLYGLRLRIQPAQTSPAAAPYVAVIYTGALLILQRRIYVGHTPLPYGRELQVANHRSIAGNFLGRIILSQKRATSVELQNLTPDWYRTYFEPFLAAATEIPFFFGWRPGSYPYEAGYAWLTSDPKPVNQLPNGLMQVSMDLEGIA